MLPLPSIDPSGGRGRQDAITFKARGAAVCSLPRLGGAGSKAATDAEEIPRGVFPCLDALTGDPSCADPFESEPKRDDGPRRRRQREDGGSRRRHRAASAFAMRSSGGGAIKFFDCGEEKRSSSRQRKSRSPECDEAAHELQALEQSDGALETTLPVPPEADGGRRRRRHHRHRRRSHDSRNNGEVPTEHVEQGSAHDDRTSERAFEGVPRPPQAPLEDEREEPPRSGGDVEAGRSGRRRRTHKGDGEADTPVSVNGGARRREERDSAERRGGRGRRGGSRRRSSPSRQGSGGADQVHLVPKPSQAGLLHRTRGGVASLDPRRAFSGASVSPSSSQLLRRPPPGPSPAPPPRGNGLASLGSLPALPPLARR
eukprot:TRINITY_DN20996_c0_g1_i1.p1 TRINITY_DN20996_c0_g1~~TRINITY_DN20996_c0_g1_i1.p1  ORF type:complete len:371 (-),score=57.52 TRINITY_DN20996_c0_g1_i1:169-1281(-)